MSLSVLMQRKARARKAKDADEDTGIDETLNDSKELDKMNTEPIDPDYLYFQSLPDNGFVLLRTLLQLADIPTVQVDLDTMVSEMPEIKEDDSLYMQTESDKVSVFVSNIARTVTESMIRTEFDSISPVQTMQLGRSGPRGLRTAVIKFSSVEDVNRVIAAKHGTLLHGELLMVVAKRTYVGPQRDHSGGRAQYSRVQRSRAQGRFIRSRRA